MRGRRLERGGRRRKVETGEQERLTNIWKRRERKGIDRVEGKRGNTASGNAWRRRRRREATT